MVRGLFFGVIGVLLVLAVSVIIAGQLARSRLAAETPAPGQLMDVGGYQLHLYCEGHGPITVLLESGVNDFSLQWYRVQPLLAGATRTCSYDRAGLGWSEPAPHAPTLDRTVADLHTLLRAAGEVGPLVLVGHSYGGVLVRRYQQAHPGDIRGMVLVDAASEHQAQHIPGYERLVEATAEQFRSLEWLASLGLIALSTESIPARYLEGGALSRYRALLASGPFFKGAAGETGRLLANLEALRSQPDMVAPAIPVVVISRGKADPLPGMTDEQAQQYERSWGELQQTLVTTMRAGHHVIAERSGHYVQLEQPELVDQTVRELLRALH